MGWTGIARQGHTERAAASTAGSSKLCSPENGSQARKLGYYWSNWRREKLVGLCDRPQGLPRQPFGSLHPAPRLIDELTLAKGDGRITARMKSLAKVDLLILDDRGLQPPDGNARHHLLEILKDRYGQRSTLVTRQLPVARWHQSARSSESASNRIFSSYDNVVDHYCHAWNRLTEQPWRIMSIGLRQWAYGS